MSAHPRSATRAIRVLLVVLLLSSGTGGALADDAPAGDDAEAAAERLLQEVFELRRAHDDERALQTAQRAYALHPGAWVLVQVALAEAAVGRWARAYTDLRRALRERDDPRLLEFDSQLHAELRRMEARVVRLSFEIEPAGARVLVNGEDQGFAPLAEGTVVEPGTTDLDVRAAGFSAYTASFETAAGERVSRNIKLRPLPLEPAVEAVAPATPPPPQPVDPRAMPDAPRSARSNSRTPGYVLAASSVALVAGAVVTGIMASDRAAEFDAKNADSEVSKAERDEARARARTMQWINTGMWVGAAITGGISAYLLLSTPGDEQTAASGPRFGLGARGRF